VELRQHLGEVFRQLAGQKESRIEEGHLMVDHVHMMTRACRPGRDSRQALPISFIRLDDWFKLVRKRFEITG
jgi:REP element-mobilizing transposase RayT